MNENLSGTKAAVRKTHTAEECGCDHLVNASEKIQKSLCGLCGWHITGEMKKKLIVKINTPRNGTNRYSQGQRFYIDLSRVLWPEASLLLLNHYQTFYC